MSSTAVLSAVVLVVLLRVSTWLKAQRQEMHRVPAGTCRICEEPCHDEARFCTSCGYSSW